MEKSTTSISTQPNLDTPNAVFVVQGKIAIEAIEDKIVVQLDPFKTGYECKVCHGTGIEKACACGTGLNRFGTPCKECDGEPDKYKGQECRTCKGVGSTIIIPESSKTLPTSGRIVSAGPSATKRKVGERVLFGAHTGYFLPFKGNIKLRIMREHEVMCLIYAIEEDIALGDFIVLEEDSTFRS